MPILERGEARISYDVQGDGPTVLLSHGYSATSRMWKGQVEALSPQYRVITWDMRGHGQSEAGDDPGNYSEEATVEDMAALLDACRAEKAVIGGLSLGGYMSLAFHATHPERTAALLLFDCGPGYRKDEAREGWNAMAIRQAEALEKRGFEAMGMGAEVRVSTHKSAAGLALAARGMLAQRDARVIDSLPSIRVPTLVLWGSKDERYIAPSEYMASKIAGAAKVVIPDAGHAANIDQPEAFNQAVLEFLGSLSLPR